MNKFLKILPWALLIITLGFSSYAILDQGITITYHEDEIAHLKKQRDFSILFVQSHWIGKSQVEVTNFLKENKIEYFQKGNALVAEENMLFLKNGKFVRLDAMDAAEGASTDKKASTISEIKIIIASSLPVAVALSTIIYTILTALLIKESVKMRKLNSNPRVVIYLEQNVKAFNFLDIVIENIGEGCAHDVKFEVLKDLAYDKDLEQAAGSKLNKLGAITGGIVYMPPDFKIQSFFTSMFGPAFEKLMSQSILLNLTYKNDAGENLQEKINIKFTQFKGIMVLD